MDRIWKVAAKIDADRSAAYPDVSPRVAQLLLNRKLETKEAVDEFLRPDYAKDLHDPFSFREMGRAVERLLRAARDKEAIVVHGDYDADGISACAIMVTALRLVGAKVDVFLPHRELDGYGLNMRTVEDFIDRGVKVVVTCDCGIANTAEIAYAAAHGIDVIITDHHAMPAELPQPYATIHPKVPDETYPWDGLAGGGVAWKLAKALLSRSSEIGVATPTGSEKWLLDLVAISSVADMVPLLGETRTLVKYGLLVLAKTKRPGLRALMEAAGVFGPDGTPKKPIDATTIGFQIAPRLNAAGRLDHANAAYALIMETDPARAVELAASLSATNADRQRQTETCVAEARASIVQNGWDQDPAIVVAGDWPPGLVGLVAGKLMDEFYRPVFAVSMRENCVGSGRSIPEYHVVEAMKTMSDVFVKFGGHPQACGFTVKNGMVDELRERLKKHAGEIFGDSDPKPGLAIDAEISLAETNWDLIEAVKLFEPFGIGNPEPRFLSKRLRVTDLSTVGIGGKHLRLSVSQGNASRKTIAFGLGAWASKLSPGAEIDAVYTVGVNEWNGNREVQLKVVDLRVNDGGA